MKNKPRYIKHASIAKTRWAAYAAASAATALAGSQSMQAAIHYSGRLDVPFPPHFLDTTHTFPLDRAGDSVFFERQAFCGNAFFSVIGIVSGGFRVAYANYVSKLSLGQKISSGSFRSGGLGTLVKGACFDPYGEWKDHGTGYIGFRFNNGAGRQYVGKGQDDRSPERWFQSVGIHLCRPRGADKSWTEVKQ